MHAEYVIIFLTPIQTWNNLYNQVL